MNLQAARHLEFLRHAYYVTNRIATVKQSDMKPEPVNDNWKSNLRNIDNR